MSALTSRFTRAVDYARTAHADQVRKGSQIPYLYHLLGVSSLVLEFGGNEDQAIAALLHDVVEDCGEAHRASVRQMFGDAVADIVDACTDGTAEGKSALIDDEAKRKDWIARKLTYLEHLRGASDAVLLVSGCDKLHNARAIVQDQENPAVGENVFERFKGGKAGTLGYYEALARIFSERRAPMADVLDRVVGRMHALANVSAREVLHVAGNLTEGAIGK